MKPQKDFDWFKFVTTLMFTIGIGGLLLSVFFTVRLYWPDKSDFESMEENQETNEISPQTTSESAFKRDSSGSSNKQDDEKENQEMSTSLDSVVDEHSSHLNSEVESAGGASEKSEPYAVPEKKYAFGLSREAALRRTAELKVELEDILYTCVEMEAEIVSGTVAASKILDKTVKEREFERLGKLCDEQAEIKIKMLELESNYAMVSGDWEATKPGGWIYDLKHILINGYLYFGD